MKLEFYKCAHCGNVAVKLFDQGVSLSCCGEEMALLRAGETVLSTHTISSIYSPYLP